MKYTVAIFAAIAAVVNGQAECEPAAESIPACALGYIASAASANHGCGLLDFACQCSNSAALVGELAQTLIGACGDPSPVLAAVSGVCGCVSSNSGAAPLTATPSSCISQAAAIPPCALGYLASAGKAIGQCSIQDFGCQCSNFDAIQGSVAGAVASACSAGGGVQEVIQSANALCSCAGGSGGSGSMGSGSMGSGSMASATSAMGSGSGSGSSGSGSAKGSGSMPAATGGSGSSAPKATSSAKAGGAGPSVFTGAAAVPAAVGGGVLAFVGGLVAML